MTRHVHVCNPGSGPRSIARKIAQRWVRRGLARWRGEDVERIEAAGRLAVIISASRLAEIGCDRAVHTGFATVRALRNLPMVGPVEKLFRKPRHSTIST